MKELYLANISTILRLLKGLIQNIVRDAVTCINNIIPANSNDQLIIYIYIFKEKKKKYCWDEKLGRSTKLDLIK